MALINNNYVLVTEEGVDRTAETTSHPTEDGLPLSDNVQIQPISVSLTGKIVNTENATAETIINKLKALQNKGSLITYIGQCGTINNLQIQSFNTNYNNKNNGGADFDMTLKEARIAKKAYVVKKQKAKVVVEIKSKSDLKKGDIVTFSGGYVYKSSDAKNPATKKAGGSKCKINKISTLSKAKHIYHLKSQDCKYGSSRYVYGWVDSASVFVPSKPISKTSNNGGTQSVLLK